MTENTRDTSEGHQCLTGNSESIVDFLAMPDDGDIEFDPPELSEQLFNVALLAL